MRILNTAVLFAGLFATLPLSTANVDAGEFTAKVVASNDHHFRSKWENTLSADGIQVARATKFYRHESMYILVFFHGMATTPDGKCDVTFDLRISNPKRADPTTANGLLGFRGRTGDPQNVYLADSMVEIIHEDSDPYGEYLVTVTAHDKVGGKAFKCRDTFSLIKYGSDHRKISVEEAEDHFVRYYRSPNSHLVFDHMRVTLDLNGDGMPLSLGPFFREIFRDNPYLHRHLPPFLAGLTEAQRTHLLPMLKGTLEDHPALIDAVPNSSRVRQQLKEIHYPDIWDDDVVTPQELDMLWCHFFATGEIAPIRKIASAVAMTKSTDRYRHLTGEAASWSLKSNAEHQWLVRAYCEYMLRKDSKLDETTRTILAECVRQKEKRSSDRDAQEDPN